MGGAGLAAEHGELLTRLRPVRPTEKRLLRLWREQMLSEFEDFTGEDPPGVGALAGLPPPVGGELAVTDAHDRLLGSVGWRQVPHGPNAGSQCFDIGISLHPQAQGRGHGTRAQGMLLEHLFRSTGVHRVQASTDVHNLREQRALERVGFRREGVLRGAQWRAGGWHDLVLYARLRTDA